MSSGFLIGDKELTLEELSELASSVPPECLPGGRIYFQDQVLGKLQEIQNELKEIREEIKNLKDKI